VVPGRNGPPPARGGHGPGGGGRLATTHLTASAPAGRPGGFVLYADRLGTSVGWAMNGETLSLTADAGRTWRTITPSPLVDQEAGDRIDSIAAAGNDDLWVAAGDVIGLVPFSRSVDGSDRGAEILRSTDGGGRWSSSTLPGCLQTCGGNLSLSFVDRLHGFATIGPGPSHASVLYATDDGGVTWSPVATMPFAPSGSTIVFADTEDGWALSQPGAGPGSQSTLFSGSSAPSLYRTTDGGRTWARAPGLPATASYTLPTFFDDHDGVVFALAPHPTVFATADGGHRWRRVSVPVGGSVTGLAPPPHFSAPTPSHWYLSWGRTLVETTDGGATWTTVDTAVPWPLDPGPGPAKGGAWALTFLSPTDGWAVVGTPPCRAPTGCAGETLIATHDGGRTWGYLNP